MSGTQIRFGESFYTVSRSSGVYTLRVKENRERTTCRGFSDRINDSDVTRLTASWTLVNPFEVNRFGFGGWVSN